VELNLIHSKAWCGITGFTPLLPPADASGTWFYDDLIPIVESDRIIEAALNSPDIQGLRNWIRFPYYEVQQLEDGWKVIVRDLRYAHPEQESPTGISMAVVELDNDIEIRSLNQ